MPSTPPDTPGLEHTSEGKPAVPESKPTVRVVQFDDARLAVLQKVRGDLAKALQAHDTSSQRRRARTTA